MTILEQNPELRQALAGAMTPKFIATRSTPGEPNVVPLISLLPSDDKPDILFFGNFLLRKTIRNLDQDARVAILVITADLQSWALKGDFVEFQRSGPYVERQMSGALLRYNAYTGVRNVGIIRLRSLERARVLTKLQVAREYYLARAAALRGGPDGIAMPPPVRREFVKIAAIKALAWIDDDGYPSVAPSLSLQPAGAHRLVCWQERQVAFPPPGARVAANVLTLEAISYQAKGNWSANGRAGAIQVHEIYAGGPPYPGGRIA